MSAVSSIGDLIHDTRNPRKHNPRNLKVIVDSLHDVGFARSIVIDENNEILAGNGVTEAAAIAGIDRVIEVEADGNTIIAVRRRGLTDEQKQRLKYFDNRSGELADWDTEQLLADMQAGLDLSSMFREDELDELLADLLPKPEVNDDGGQVDRAAELQQQWQTATGQLWQLGEHRLICGDCTDASVVARVMGGERANAVVTDPPYGQNQTGVTNDEPEKLAGLVDGCVATLPCDNAVIVAFSSPRTFPMWLDAVRKHGHKFERMLWMYKAAQETFPWRGWLLTSEAILVSSVGAGQWQDVHPYSHDCYYKSEVSGQLDDSLGWHGSVKPLDVVMDLVSRVSAGGHIVYDPFSGSGTTLLACENLNRKSRAIEISAAYTATTLQRYADATGQTPVLVE